MSPEHESEVNASEMESAISGTSGTLPQEHESEVEDSSTATQGFLNKSIVILCKIAFVK